MRKITLLAAVLALIAPLYTHADDAIYCPAGKVLEIQSQPDNVIVKISNGVGWKQLGEYSETALPSRMSIVLTAQASDKNVMLAFPLDSGVVCSESSWNVSPYKVRISK